MESTKAGANRWPIEEARDFHKLTSEAAIEDIEHGPLVAMGTTITWMKGDRADSGLGDGEKMLRCEERLAATWSQVKRHSVYTRLVADDHFLRAREVFMFHQGRSPKSPYGNPYAELRLFREVATIVTAQANHPDAVRKVASRETKHEVLRLAKELREILERKWFGLGSLTSPEFLTRLTDGIVGLEEGLHTPPPRVDADAARRYWIDALIQVLRTTFGAASAGMVAAIGKMMNYSPHPATIRRRIATDKLETQRASRLRQNRALPRR